MLRTEGRKFPGKAALCERRVSDNRWSMALIQIDDTDGPAFFGHPVLLDGRPVGVVTSGAYGFRTGASLALAYLRMAEPPENLHVSVLEREHTARSLRRAPFDPDNSRVKSDTL